MLNMVNPFTRSAPVAGLLKADRPYGMYLFMALPLLVHGWMVYRFSTNMPYLDDYTLLVDSLNLKTAHLTAPQLLTAIFYPHGEHVIIFARLTALIAALQPLQDRIAALRTAHAGKPVAATEPVFGPMAAALGLQVRNERFALAVMNGAEPRPSDVAAFEADLRARRVRALLYNSQTSNPAAARLLAIARMSGVPVVGVTEAQPAGATYVSWMLAQLDELDRALSQP